jgi:hypothetical protein
MPPVMPAPKLAPICRGSPPRRRSCIRSRSSRSPRPPPWRPSCAREAFARAARGEQIAVGRAVEHGVADDRVLFRDQRAEPAAAARRWCRPTGPCRHSRWHRPTPPASAPAPRRRPATGRPSPVSLTVRWSGCRLLRIPKRARCGSTCGCRWCGRCCAPRRTAASSRRPFRKRAASFTISASSVSGTRCAACGRSTICSAPSTVISSGFRSRSSRCAAPRLTWVSRSARPITSSSDRAPISRRGSRALPARRR